MPSPDLIFMVSMPFNRDQSHLQYALATWEPWCRRQGARLFIQREPLEDVRLMKPTWQRYHLFDILERAGIAFDRVAMVDCDVMARWDCPRFFDLAGEGLGVVRDTSWRWLYQSCQSRQHLFPGVDLPWHDYFNAGVMVVNHRHRRFFRAVLDFYRQHRDQLLELERAGGGTDQTIVNYLARRERIPLTYLPPPFNLQPINNLAAGDLFVEMGYLWHFAGHPDDARLTAMKDTWERHASRYTVADPTDDRDGRDRMGSLAPQAPARPNRRLSCG
jgi:lipopolysaccharide biosynthesis glycosyltransferase